MDKYWFDSLTTQQMHMDWNAEDKQAEAEGHQAAGIKRVPTFTSRDDFCSRARVTKYSLFFISFLTWVAGGTLVGVGIWWRLLKTWLVAFDPVLVDMAFLFIGLGVIMIVVSSFGCFGALREHVCFLKTFIFAIGVVFVAQVVLGMLAFLTLDMLEDKMLSFTRNAMSDFRKGDDSREIDDAIDYLQETYMCCGGVSFQDWEFNAAQPTPTQLAYTSSSNNDHLSLINTGRIICLTHMKSEAHVRSLEECVVDAVNQHNKLAVTSETLLPISHCEVIFIHITPVGEELRIQERGKREISSQVFSEVHVTQSGKFLYYKIVSLAQQHYNLASTTVTGIPMKEEQNASSSANYDVELLHPAAVHGDILKNEHAEGILIPSKEGLPTFTITLKWCTPKSNVVELHNCTGVYRITPVDVNSRPSSCLTNFLLAGRAVMLEQPRKSGTKVISHMLASHGGEIFVHVLPTCRSVLEDPPSISEGCGGRVTDYRINDFGEYMKENRLAPSISTILATACQKPIIKAIERLERSSRFWPIVITETILGNIASSISPLPALMMKDELTDDEVLECKKVIYNIVSMETKNEALPGQMISSRGKGPKRDEQYRQLWNELESLVRSNSDLSSQHEKVLGCLLECKKPSNLSEDPRTSPRQPSDSTEALDDHSQGLTDPSLHELNKLQKTVDREKQEFTKGEKTETSPPKKSRTDELLMRPGGQSLLSLWTNRIKSVHNKRHAEFVGRIESEGLKANLYSCLNNTDGDHRV